MEESGTVKVHEVPYDGGAVLELYSGDQFFGVYEDSRVPADDPDREAKIKEAEGVSDLLLEAAALSPNGKVAVQWNSAARRKEIREFDEDRPHNPGFRQRVIAEIPQPRWRKVRRKNHAA